MAVHSTHTRTATPDLLFVANIPTWNTDICVAGNGQAEMEAIFTPPVECKIASRYYVRLLVFLLRS